MSDSWQSVSKSPNGTVLKFAELSLVRLAAGILIFSNRSIIGGDQFYATKNELGYKNDIPKKMNSCRL
jgi:hypothetical protein